MSKQIKLSIFDNFKCLADACPDACCGGWDIEIDEVTQQRWQQIEDKQQRQNLLDSIIIQQGNNKERKIFRLNSDRNCVHLADNKLCTLQTHIGADFLPKACREFPRQYGSTNLKTLTTLSMACPEVVRMVLFVSRQPVYQEDNCSSNMPALTGHDMASETLDAWVSNLLRIEKYPISVKLTYIAQQLGRMSALNARGDLNGSSLYQLIRSPKNDLYELNIFIKNKKLKINDFTTGSYWLSVYQIFANCADMDVSNSPLLAGLQKLTQEQDKSIRYTGVYELIGKARGKYSVLQSGYTQALQRYVEASFMNKGFPWEPFSQNFIATYLNCVIPFTAVQLMIWAAAEQKLSLTEGDIINSIYKVERVIGHSQTVYKKLANYPELLHIEAYSSSFQDLF